MTIISWCMLILGMSIGFLVAGLSSYKQMDKELEEIERHHAFFTDFSKTLMEQYKILEDQLNNYHEVYKNFLSGIADISAKMSENNRDLGVQLTKTVMEDHEHKNKMIDAIRKDLTLYDEVNSERWNMICDYITNKEPEFSNGETEVDLEAEGLI